MAETECEKVDIVEVVPQITELKRVGRFYLSMRPFHQEKTPFSTVDPVSLSYRCLGCGVEGDVQDFISRQKKRSETHATALFGSGG